MPDIIDWDEAHKVRLAADAIAGERYRRLGAAKLMFEIERCWEHLRRAGHLVVLDEGDGEDDLVQDMVEVLTWLCARRYGRRSARNRARKALESAGHG